jgi:predicted PurR-regulated permease PerM
MKRVVLTTVGILGTITVLLIMWQLSEIVVLFIVSIAVAAALRAPLDALMRRGWAQSWAMLAVYGVGLGGLVGVLALVSWRMVVELEPLANDLIALYVQLYSGLQTGSGLMQAIAGRLPDPTSLGASVGDEQTEAFIAAVVSGTRSAGTIGSQLLIAVVVSIYWTADRLRFERLWLSLLPPEQRGRARSRWRALEKGVGTYLRSELIQSLIAGTALAALYWLLGFRYPVLLAFISAVSWLIPLVGAPIAVAAVLLFGWNLGPLTVAGAAALTVGVFLVLDLYVEPRLYTSDQVWRVLVLLVMLAMVDAFGFIGLLVAPPLATAIYLWLDDLLAPPALATQTTPSLDLADVHAKLELARSLIQEGDEPASPRINNLFERLEDLVDEVEGIDEVREVELEKSPAA